MNTNCCIIPPQINVEQDSILLAVDVAQGATIELTFKLSISLSSVIDILITFKQLDTIIFEKDIEDITIIDDDSFVITLTQQESFLLSAKYPTLVQVRTKDTEDITTTSVISSFYIREALNNTII